MGKKRFLVIVSFVLFVILFTHSFGAVSHPFGQNFLAAVIGAVLTYFVTQVQLENQSNNELDVKKAELLSTSRFEVYQKLICAFIELEGRYKKNARGINQNWVGVERCDEIKESEQSLEQLIKQSSLLMDKETFNEVYSFFRFVKIFGFSELSESQKEIYAKYFDHNINLWGVVRKLRSDIIKDDVLKNGEFNQEDIDRKYRALHKYVNAESERARS